MDEKEKEKEGEPPLSESWSPSIEASVVERG
jgi:hypothetical protein